MKCLFDSHCHLYDERYNEAPEDGGLGGFDALIPKILDSDIKFVADIGLDVATSHIVLENTKKFDFCYGVVGFYPGEVETITDEGWDEVFGIYENNEKIVAIGEIGLDYHDPEHYPSREIQQYWFRKQLQKAVELNAPVCIHSRDADQDSFNMLKEEALGKIPVLLHCYSGSLELAKQYVKLGAYISIGGPVTFKNARHSAEVAANIPLEQLLIETDAPYLTPIPYRGKINMPQ